MDTDTAGQFGSHTTRLHCATRVVKVGGSLIADRRLASRLIHWLDAQTPWPTLLIVGGGALADGVRALDARHGLPAAIAHEQAIRAMQVNSFALLQLCNELSWLTHLPDWQPSHSSVQRVILDPLEGLRNVKSLVDDGALPIGWHVTSDSIAANVAHRLGAAELVLLKSALPTRRATTMTHAAATNMGYVDPYFATAARKLVHVRAVNFRDETLAEIRLTHQ